MMIFTMENTKVLNCTVAYFRPPLLLLLLLLLSIPICLMLLCAWSIYLHIFLCMPNGFFWDDECVNQRGSWILCVTTKQRQQHQCETFMLELSSFDSKRSRKSFRSQKANNGAIFCVRVLIQKEVFIPLELIGNAQIHTQHDH